MQLLPKLTALRLSLMTFFCVSVFAYAAYSAPETTDPVLVGVDPVTAPFAADAVVEPPAVSPADPDPVSLISQIYAAIKDGKWTVVVALVLSLIIFGLRKFGGKISPWFETRTGGYALAFGAAFIGVIAVGLSAGAGLSASMLLSAVSAGFAAIGIHTAAKDVAAKS